MFRLPRGSTLVVDHHELWARRQIRPGGHPLSPSLSSPAPGHPFAFWEACDTILLEALLGSTRVGAGG